MTPIIWRSSIATLCAVAMLVWLCRRRSSAAPCRRSRDNELAAGVVGVDTYRTKVIAFTLSSILGGLGGGLFAGGFSYISPDQFSFSESVVFLTMVLLGGCRSPLGAVLGTALLIMLPEWLRFLKIIYLAVYGAAVILIMVFMPDGIWGFADCAVAQIAAAPPLAVGEIAPLPLARQVATRWRPYHAGSLPDMAKHFGGLKAVDGVELHRPLK